MSAPFSIATLTSMLHSQKWQRQSMQNAKMTVVNHRWTSRNWVSVGRWDEQHLLPASQITPGFQYPISFEAWSPILKYWNRIGPVPVLGDHLAQGSLKWVPLLRCLLILTQWDSNGRCMRRKKSINRSGAKWNNIKTGNQWHFLATSSVAFEAQTHPFPVWQLCPSEAPSVLAIKVPQHPLIQ